MNRQTPGHYDVKRLSKKLNRILKRNKTEKHKNVILKSVSESRSQCMFEDISFSQDPDSGRHKSKLKLL